MRLALTVFFILTASGCGASFSGPPAIAIGTGGDSFLALADGDPIPIVHGTQGGYHVWGSLRAHAVDPRGLSLRFTLVVDGDSQPAAVRDDRVDLDGGGGDATGMHAGTVVFLSDPALVRGRLCHFRVEATDGSGRSGSDEKRVVPEGP